MSTDAQLLAQLDAYGHLTWVLGDDDWQACFDAIREGDRIAYHVVVNCESGGFIDTIEKGVLALSEAARLADLPDRYVDAGYEHHATYPRWRGGIGRFAWKDCARRWRRHIKQLIKGE